MNDLCFTAKNKKVVTLITFAESVYHPSENEYISLSDEYIINAEHCIDAHRLAIPSLRSLHHYGVLIHAKA